MECIQYLADILLCPNRIIFGVFPQKKQIVSHQAQTYLNEFIFANFTILLCPIKRLYLDFMASFKDIRALLSI